MKEKRVYSLFYLFTEETHEVLLSGVPTLFDVLVNIVQANDDISIRVGVTNIFFAVHKDRSLFKEKKKLHICFTFLFVFLKNHRIQG